MSISTVILDNSIEVPQKIRTTVIQESRHWVHMQRKGNQCIKKVSALPHFFTEVFITVKKCKHPKCPSTDEQIKKTCYIYTIEYYSAMKKRMKFCHL